MIKTRPAARRGPRRRIFGARTFAALRVRNYRLYFIGQTISVSGTSMQMVAQAWLVLKLTGSGIDLGGVVAAQFLPLLVFGSYGGVVADRVDKRRLIITTQSLGALLALVLGVLTATHDVRMWMVYVIAFLLGGVTAVDNPARQIFASEMVGAALVGNAVSLNEVVINASRVFGPAVGGVVIATAGTATCFLVNAASYSPAIVALVMMRPAELYRVVPAARARGQLRDGVRYALSAPILRSLILMAAASAMVFNFGVSLPVMAKSVLHVGPDGYGAMIAAFGCGALGGAFLAASDPKPAGRRVAVLATATGASVLVCATMPNLVTELLTMAAAGVTSIWFVSLANAVLQLRTEPTMRGRVMGLWTMALPGSLPLSGPVVGWVAQSIGGRAALGLGGVVVLLTTALGWRPLMADDHQVAGRLEAAPQVAGATETTPT